MIVKIKKSNNHLSNKELKQNLIAKVNKMNKEIGLNNKYMKGDNITFSPSIRGLRSGLMTYKRCMITLTDSAI